jgi:hypothetical protein
MLRTITTQTLLFVVEAEALQDVSLLGPEDLAGSLRHKRSTGLAALEHAVQMDVSCIVVAVFVSCLGSDHFSWSSSMTRFVSFGGYRLGYSAPLLFDSPVHVLTKAAKSRITFQPSYK